VAVACPSGQPAPGPARLRRAERAHSRRAALKPVGLKGGSDPSGASPGRDRESGRTNCGRAAANRRAGRPAPPPRRSAPQRRSRAASAGLKKNHASCKYLVAKFFPASISNPVSQPFGLLSD
jgi:hypothetical protein